MSGGLEIALWALLVIASLTDLIWGKVFNLLTFAFLITGLICRFWLGGLPSLGEACLAVAVAFALFFPLWLAKVMAAGDVKLLMAAGAWTSVGVVVHLALGGIVIGALVGAALLVRRSGWKGGALSVRNHLKTAVPRASQRMPFAPAFLCAFFLVKVAEMYRWSLL